PLAGRRRSKRNLVRLRFGTRIVVLMPQRAYLAAKAGVLFGCVFAYVAAATLVIAQSLHPARGYAFRFVDALTSPQIVSAIFGFRLGLLVGDLVNRALRGDRHRTFSAQDWVQVFLILTLFVLGIGGEEIIRSSAARISKLSFGATNEIEFSTAPSRGPS